MKYITKTLLLAGLIGSIPAFAHPGHPAAHAVHSHGAAVGLGVLVVAVLAYLAVRASSRRN